jgi:hypothetical protein
MVLVKNEQYFLPYVLKQTEDLFDSYVIYDVGSTDRTRDIIDWWTDRVKDKADLFVRYLPDVDPKVQGTFRNSMIAEGRRDIYFILDGDELYTQEDLKKITPAAYSLDKLNDEDRKKRYGVFSRVELSEDLTRQYCERRTHHRLYTRDAFWTGSHPGEVAGHRQNEKSEVHFDDITCWHFHNTLRSPKEADATRRLIRKGRKTYHPGTTMDDVKLLDILPILRKPIEDFSVTPALAKLQEEWE